MAILARLRISHKLSALVIAFTIPLAFTTLGFLEENALSVEFSKKERLGVEYLTILRPTWGLAAEHRGLSQVFLNGATELKSDLRSRGDKINEALQVLAEVDERTGAALSTGDKVADVTRFWEALVADNDSLNPETSFSRHTQFVTMLQDLGVHVTDQSNLTLDPDLDSYYLMDTVAFGLPPALEYLGQLRGKAAGYAANGALTPAQLSELAVLEVRSSEAVNRAVRAVEVAIEYNPSVADAVGPPSEKLADHYGKFKSIIESELLNASVVAVNPEEVFKAGTDAISDGVALFNAAIPVLDQLLVDRVNGHLGRRNNSMMIIGAFLVLALGIATFVIRGVSGTAAYASGCLSKIADGDYDFEIETKSEDELGQVLKTLSNMQGDVKKRSESERVVNRQNERIRRALDDVNANVMLANRNYELLYVNKSMERFFQERESKLRRDLPEFRAEEIVGNSMDVFFPKDSAHQRKLIENLTSTHTADLAVGELALKIIVDPVWDDSGERLGTVVTWSDLTDERRLEEQLQEVVDAAIAGDLSRRLELGSSSGFYHKLGESMNGLLDVNERVINDIVRILGALAQGDLTQGIDSEYEGSFDQLKHDANTTVARLTEVIGQIKEGAKLINSGTEEISQGNLDLSNRTERQAASLEETASSMQEMTTTVKRNAENAQQANALAVSTRDQAEKGGEVVSRAVDAMQGINTASQKIADIIGVIDEIAFQTNLLALNAAVEAARAGEQGRGFAVVASEVRNLAQRSATAAKEIKELIEDSVVKVTAGTKLVDESGDTLKDIVGSVKKVSDIVAEITKASQEQSEGIEKVGHAVAQMDSGTQQNASLVEQAAAASQSMSEQAGRMFELVSFFDIRGEPEASVRPRETVSATPPPIPPPASSAGSNMVVTPNYVGPERRGADRPWSKPAEASDSAPRLSATGTDDSEEWEEF